MTLATPLVLVLVLPLAVLFATHVFRERPAMTVADIGPLAAAARPTARLRLRRLPDVLRALAILALLIAIARPREGLAVTVLPEEGIDIVAAVDVSTSMNQRATDRESRLEVARGVLDDFARTLQGDRLGLVAFQSRALTLSPPTSDVLSIRRRIDQLAPGLVADGTAIGLGIAEALTLLEESPARSRVVVLLTDGENNAGEVEPFAAARIAEALGIRIYTIGFTGGSFGSRVDREGLTQLAELTDGEYFNAQTPEELEAAYETIGDLERSRVGEREFVAFREYGPWFALAAAGLLVLDLALRSTWLRRQP